MNIKRYSLVQINVFLRKTKFTPLKSDNFHFKKPAKQILANNFLNKAREKFNLAKIFCNVWLRL